MNGKKDITRTTEQLRAANPANSVWVMANAGSGKTHVLVDRVVRLLLKGFPPQSILCLTFTKAAAAEMSLRLFKLLSSWIARNDHELKAELESLGTTGVGAVDLAQARRLFATAIETPGGLKIQTIHAFCEKLLQLFPVESGLAPGFRVMDDADRKALLEEARVAALADAVAEADEALLLFEEGLVSTPDSFEALVKFFLPATSLFRTALDPSIDEGALETLLRQAVGLMQDVSTENIETDIVALDREKFAAAAMAFGDVPPYGGHKFDVHTVLKTIAACDAADELITALFALAFTNGGELRGKLFKAETMARLPDVCAWIDATKIEIAELLCKHALSRKVDATVSLLRLLRRVDQRFSALKQERGLYDFDDLIMRTQALLQESRAAQWVLYKLDAGLSHILVDEAQDTSPKQWQIITALADEFFAGAGPQRRTPRTVFVVGDIKQSIYSFQGADTVAFTWARDFFQGRVAAHGDVLQEIDLTVSYRSLPAVLEIVDVVFAANAPASKGLKQIDGKDRPHEAQRRTEGQGIFELWPPFLPIEKGERDQWQAPVDRETEDAPRQQLAQHVAETIDGWIGKRVLASKQRAVAAGDILILLQKRGPLFDALIAELRLRGIPVAGADRLKLQQSLAVKDLMALIQFCLLPEDDLSLACVLKCPLLAHPLDDDDLIAIAPGRKGSLWQALLDSGHHPGAVASLQQWREEALVSGPHGFLARVLAQARRAMVEHLGVEAQDATDMLLDVALAFERDHGTSLAAFLHWFMAREENVKRDLEAEGGQVRLMTVHGAKGLEANIVILPDATEMPGQRGGPPLLAVPTGGNEQAFLPLFDAATAVKPPSIRQWRDAQQEKDRHERMRLLYVAMTRAKDELYVAGAQGDKKLADNCWYALVKSALDQSTTTQLRKVVGQHPAGDIERHGDEPQWLATAAEQEPPTAPSLPEWVRTPVLRDRSEARWSSVTRMASGTSHVFDRAAAERGLAIHKVLEHARSGDSLETLTQRLHRHKLEPDLAAPLHALLSDAETAPYFSPDAESEATFVGRLDGLEQVQGRVDRLLVTAETVWVLDFKSGRRPGKTPDDYIRQMAVYAAVLADIFPGRAVKAALLWTQDGTLEHLADPVLSRSLEWMRQEQQAKTA